MENPIVRNGWWLGVAPSGKPNDSEKSRSHGWRIQNLHELIHENHTLASGDSSDSRRICRRFQVKWWWFRIDIDLISSYSHEPFFLSYSIIFFHILSYSIFICHVNVRITGTSSAAPRCCHQDSWSIKLCKPQRGEFFGHRPNNNPPIWWTSELASTTFHQDFSWGVYSGRKSGACRCLMHHVWYSNTHVQTWV